MPVPWVHVPGLGTWPTPGHVGDGVCSECGSHLRTVMLSYCCLSSYGRFVMQSGKQLKLRWRLIFLAAQPYVHTWHVPHCCAARCLRMMASLLEHTCGTVPVCGAAYPNLCKASTLVRRRARTPGPLTADVAGGVYGDRGPVRGLCGDEPTSSMRARTPLASSPAFTALARRMIDRAIARARGAPAGRCCGPVGGPMLALAAPVASHRAGRML